MKLQKYAHNKTMKQKAIIQKASKTKSKNEKINQNKKQVHVHMKQTNPKQANNKANRRKQQIKH